MAHVRNPGEKEAPHTSCSDVRCPFHGELKVRGRSITGTVTSTKAQKTVVVSWEYRKIIPKYGRYKRATTKVSAHLPECLDVVEGDVVKIKECRPISKTKRFVVVLKKGAKRTYELEKELAESGKHKITKAEEANKAAAKKDESQ